MEGHGRVCARACIGVARPWRGEWVGEWVCGEVPKGLWGEISGLEYSFAVNLKVNSLGRGRLGLETTFGSVIVKGKHSPAIPGHRPSKTLLTHK